MLCALSSVLYDPIGHVMIDASDQDSDLGETTRRMSRVATLDGGAAVNDFGHSWADRTFKLRWDGATRAGQDEIERLVRLYSRLTFACSLGVFTVAPDRFMPGTTQSSITLLAIEKLNE